MKKLRKLSHGTGRLAAAFHASMRVYQRSLTRGFWVCYLTGMGSRSTVIQSIRVQPKPTTASRMSGFPHIAFVLALMLFVNIARADDAPKQVMPALKRQKIVALAQALFEPQVKTSVHIGHVASPFAATPAQ